ncbi:unnamed protein product [Choristocarpus tenellus]
MSAIVTERQDNDSPLWLGLDLSTQSLTLVLLSDTPGAPPVYVDSLQYAQDLPHYNTEHGMHIRDGDNGEKASYDNAVVTSPVTMWVDALDIILSRLAFSTKEQPDKCGSTGKAKDGYSGKGGDGGDEPMTGSATWGSSVLGRVRAVSVSGQQHGTVYWKCGAGKTLAAMAELDRKTTLLDALHGCFARQDCPIWADSSTTKECIALEQALGGAKGVADATGSAAYCRFSGNQIARIARLEPTVYTSCERVSLVSSFLTGVLAGCHCPVDAADASGMNLMDIRTLDWHEGALAATGAEGLQEKLGQISDSYATVGEISPFFTRKFGINPR